MPRRRKSRLSRGQNSSVTFGEPLISQELSSPKEYQAPATVENEHSPALADADEVPVVPETESACDAPAVLEVELDRFKQELAEFKGRHAIIAEKVEAYDALSARCVPNQPACPESLATHICKLAEEERELEDLKAKNAALEEALEKIKTELDQQKASYAELLATADNETGSPNLNKLSDPNDRMLISKLEEECRQKDELIAELKAKLEAAVAAAEAAERLEVVDTEDEEENDIIAMAENELKLMEDLIKEQETYINDLERELASEGTEDVEAANADYDPDAKDKAEAGAKVLEPAVNENAEKDMEPSNDSIKSDSDAEKEPEEGAEAEAGSEASATLQPNSAPEPENENDLESNSDAEPSAGAEPNAAAEPSVDTDPNSIKEPDPIAEPDPTADLISTAEPDTTAETVTKEN